MPPKAGRVSDIDRLVGSKAVGPINSFGSWLIAKRGSQKQSTFAEAVGVDERIYRRWEHNQYFPEERRRADLAKVLQVKLAEIEAWGQPPEFFDLRPHLLSKSFVGRAKEWGHLDRWLRRSSETAMLVWAFGGFGKSELCRQWVNIQCGVPKAKHGFRRILWWSFYSYNADFFAFIEAMVASLSEPKWKRSRLLPAETLEFVLQRLREEAWLIVFDGFERELNAYSDFRSVWTENENTLTREQRRCTSPLLGEFLRRVLDINSGTRLLITSRVVPAEFQSADDRLLANVDELRLGDLSPKDSATLLRRNGIRGPDSALAAEMSAYGGHPLALRILCAAIASDPKQPHVAKLSSRRSLIRSVFQRTEHVLSRAFKNLSPSARTAIETIACFRAPVVAEQILSLHSRFKGQTILTAFRELISFGLLVEVESEKYALHPLVAGYAYRQSNRTKELHRNIASQYAREAARPLEQVDTLDHLFSPIEQMFHLTQARQFEDAFKLFEKVIARPLYFHVAAPHKRIELVRLFFPRGEDRAPALKAAADQGQAIEYLANSYAGAGECSAAYDAYKRQIALYRRHRLPRLGTVLGAIATVACLPLGFLAEAHDFLHERLTLNESVSDAATAKYQMCLLLSYLGRFDEAQRNADLALVGKLPAAQQSPRNHQAVAIVYLYSGLGYLMEGKLSEATRAARKANGHLNVFSQVRPLLPRDKLQLEWIRTEAVIRGAWKRKLVHYHELESQVFENIRLSRTLGLAQFEADFLLTLARLYLAGRSLKKAYTAAEDAHQFSKDMRYRLRMADAQLLLALVHKGLGDVSASKRAASRAVSLARPDAHPYWYHPAVQLAHDILAGLPSG